MIPDFVVILQAVAYLHDAGGRHTPPSFWIQSKSGSSPRDAASGPHRYTDSGHGDTYRKGKSCHRIDRIAKENWHRTPRTQAALQCWIQLDPLDSRTTWRESGRLMQEATKNANFCTLYCMNQKDIHIEYLVRVPPNPTF